LRINHIQNIQSAVSALEIIVFAKLDDSNISMVTNYDLLNLNSG